jgi:hypothetical protein
MMERADGVLMKDQQKNEPTWCDWPKLDEKLDARQMPPSKFILGSNTPLSQLSTLQLSAAVHSLPEDLYRFSKI